MQRSRVADQRQLDVDQRQRVHEVAARRVNRLHVVEHAHRHLVRRRRCQRIRSEVRQIRVGQPALDIGTAQQICRQGVDQHAVRAQQEVTGEVDALRRHAQCTSDDQVRNAERDRDAPVRTQHLVDATRIEALKIVAGLESFVAQKVGERLGCGIRRQSRRATIAQRTERGAHLAFVYVRFERSGHQ